MPFLGFMLLCLAVGYWIGSARRRRRMREQTRREVEHALKTGLPDPSHAVGRKAQEVAEAAERKLVDPPPVHGTARWATAADVVGLLDGNRLAEVQGTDGLLLGELIDGGADTGLPLVARYPGHILTVAGTGQGKSATQLVANLHRYDGSVVVLDPKGELFALTAEARRRFGRVFRIAPLRGEADPLSHRYNPLDELGPPRERPARARQLAEMLVVRQGDKGASEAAFFENEAVNLLTLLILGAVEMAELAGEPDQATLAAVRQNCTLPLLGDRPERDPAVAAYFEDLMLLYAQRGTSALVRRQGASFAARERKLLSSFLSEINANLAFFDGHPGFAEVTEASDLRMADLATATTTVYLTVPLKETHTSFRFLRAMIGCAFTALEERSEAERASVLFILDEFPALRDMPFMRDAVAQMRSSGAWFWFLVQDVAQLEAVYREWANVFLSQTDHQVYFGATQDARTKKHISTQLGVGTYAYRDPNVNWTHTVGTGDNENTSPVQLGGVGQGRNVGQSVSITEPIVLAPRPLMTPFEVGTYLSERRPGESHPSTALIFSKQAGGFPIKARRLHWREIAALPPLSASRAPPFTNQETRHDVVLPTARR
jgi:type IV secretion system protein VirD4